MTVSPVWPLIAITVPAEGAMIWVSASLTLSEASWAWSLANWAPAAATLACVPLTFDSARPALSAAMAARSALTAAVVDGDVSVASTWPALTAWPSWTGTFPTRPEFAKFRLVTPLLLTVPVNERPSARTIRGTYQTAAATTITTIRMPPMIWGVVTGRRVGPSAPATVAGAAGAAALAPWAGAGAGSSPVSPAASWSRVAPSSWSRVAPSWA